MSSIEPHGIEQRSIDRAAQMNALHLYGMATAWNEWLAEGPRRPDQPEAWLDRMIEAELADRQVRSVALEQHPISLDRSQRRRTCFCTPLA